MHRAGGEVGMGFTSKGYRISFCSDESILKVTVMQLSEYTRKY